MNKKFVYQVGNNKKVIRLCFRQIRVATGVMSECGICVWGFFSGTDISFDTSLAFASRPVYLLEVNTASVFFLVVRMFYPINQPDHRYHNVISEFVTFLSRSA